jgi:hypothetical protein
LKIKEKKADDQPELTAAVAVVQPAAETAVAKHNDHAYAVGGVSGDIGDGDLSMPKINIVQAVGPLSEDFSPGTILFNKQITLMAANKDPKEYTAPIGITVLNARKQFQKVTDYDSDEQGEIVDTMAEVEAKGGWIDWRNEEKPPWRPMLTALVLIQAPSDDIAEQFSIVGPDDKSYELALWVMTGVSYTAAAKPILTASLYSLKNKESGKAELNHGRWELCVRREKKGANLVYVPRLQLKGKHDAAFIQFTEGLL